MNQSTYESQHERVDRWEKRINEQRHPPKIVMKAIGIKSGMIIGEIGAGRGRYTVLLAKEVGKTGKIFANDIKESVLSYLQERCRLNNILNIKTILGKMNDPLLPKKTLDMAFMVWVFHMIEDPVPLMKNLKSSLKQGAPLIIIDPPDKEIDAEIEEMTGKKPDPNRLTIRQRIEKAAKEADYEVIKVDTSLPKDTIYTLQVKK